MKNHDLAKLVVKECKTKGIYLVTVESCTGGGLVNELTNIPGASEVIKRSFVIYSNDAKIDLGIAKEVIDKYSVYSRETAIEMALAGLYKSPEATLGIGITGTMSRSDPANPGVAPGVAYVATKYRTNEISKEYHFNETNRVKAKEIMINHALEQILEAIQEKKSNE